jgi:hypothetical protein
VTKEISLEDLAAWAKRKRVRSHLTDGRTDPAKCTCSGGNCLAAQEVADLLREIERRKP